MLVSVVNAPMQVGHLVEKDGLPVFILHAQVPTVVCTFLFSLAIMLHDPMRPFLVAFLEPEEETVICPKGEFAGILGSVDVFVILVPAPHDPVESTHLFQWGLVEGVSASLFFEGMFEPFDAHLVGSDPEPGFLVSWQFPLQMVTQKVKAIGGVGDVGFLQREFQLECIP